MRIDGALFLIVPVPIWALILPHAPCCIVLPFTQSGRAQVQFAVGLKFEGKMEHVVVDAEDALIAAQRCQPRVAPLNEAQSHRHRAVIRPSLIFLRFATVVRERTGSQAAVGQSACAKITTYTD
jgi:hypothetical protein